MGPSPYSSEMTVSNPTEEFDSWLYRADDLPSNISSAVEPPSVAQSVDSVLAREVLSLSFKDRNAINEEMHGVSCLLPEETPELIDASLVKLEHEFSLIPSQDKKMYELCQERYGSMNSSQAGGSYINDRDFRVRFLRCELYDAAKSARRIAAFLDVVVDLFGEYALRRPMRLSDFTEDELHVFRMGNLQLLPFRDRSGRRIIVAVEGLAIQFDSTLRVRRQSWTTYFLFSEARLLSANILTLLACTLINFSLVAV